MLYTQTLGSTLQHTQCHPLLSKWWFSESLIQESGANRKVSRAYPCLGEQLGAMDSASAFFFFIFACNGVRWISIERQAESSAKA